MKFTQARLELIKNWGLKKIPWTKYWKINTEFVWYLDYKNKKQHIIVPKGFKTDFGSIPRWLWFIFNPTQYISYIKHDYLTNQKWEIINDDWTITTWKWKIVDENWEEIPYTRWTADKILIEWLDVEWAWVLTKIWVYIWVSLWTIWYYIFNYK